MTMYTAKFSTETITRKSNREYTHAFLLTGPNGEGEGVGFSGSRELAEKAARQYGPKSFANKRVAHVAAWHRKLAKEEGFKSVQAMYDARDAEIADWWSKAKIEIVEVERA